MGRKSIKENKTIYQLSRENAGLSREEAGFRMTYVTEDRLEKIENERTKAKPEDVIEMAKCYEDTLLCNRHCTSVCPIGKRRVPVIKEKQLPLITINIVNAINHLYEKKDSLIGIAGSEHLSESALDELIELSLELSSLNNDVESLKLFLRKELEGGVK